MPLSKVIYSKRLAISTSITLGNRYRERHSKSSRYMTCTYHKVKEFGQYYR